MAPSIRQFGKDGKLVLLSDPQGKEGLASTIIIEFLDENGSGDGEAYLGSDCAARKLAGRADRRLAAKITREAKAAAKMLDPMKSQPSTVMSNESLPCVSTWLKLWSYRFVFQFVRMKASSRATASRWNC